MEMGLPDFMREISLLAVASVDVRGVLMPLALSKGY